MADMTAEERAQEILLSSMGKEHSPLKILTKEEVWERAVNLIAGQIRQAEQAMKERAAKVAENRHKGEFGNLTKISAGEEIAIAIRALKEQNPA